MGHSDCYCKAIDIQAVSLSQIKKSDANSSSHVTSLKYHLVPLPSRNALPSPCIPVTITGGDQQVTHHITDVNTGKPLDTIHFTESVFLYVDPSISWIDKELLDILSLTQVRIKHNTFLQQLAMKLPHWQSTAKLLGLSEVDIRQIEHDYPTGQREDGSFPPIYRGEQAYQALRWWTESKGHYATYGDLLVALHNTTISNELTTDAWWYAYQELTSSVSSL